MRMVKIFRTNAELAYRLTTETGPYMPDAFMVLTVHKHSDEF